MVGHHSKKRGKKTRKSNTQQSTKKSAQVGGRQQQSTTLHVRQQLHQIGACVYDVPADGNCLFRSLYDQLECLEDAGGVEDHVDLRKRIVEEISAREEFFGCFIEDDESFEDYIERMSQEGAWGGNIEIQAFSTLFHVNVRIYQSFTSSWTVLNFPEEGAHMVHVSYHDGNHYNSVRDTATGKPLSCCSRVGHDAGNLAAVKVHAQEENVHHHVDNAQNESHDSLSIRVEIRVRQPDNSNAPCCVTCVVLSDSVLPTNKQKKTKKKDTCPCGSMKKYKKCCKKRIERSKTKTLAESAEESLARSFTTHIYV